MSTTDSKVICPSCNSENLPGTLFCVQCGIYLASGGPLRTEPLPENANEQPAIPRSESEGEIQNGAVLGIEIEVIKSERKILLSVDREILVGRLDATQGIFPELDLTADGALEHGISRRHARIYSREGKCYIEDLNSSNHTLLNGERLIAHLPYAFRDGDTLSFGSLEMKVHIYTN
jgi:pSer/pThr/pTyr-binding forkhead associated (FHA) protein